MYKYKSVSPLEYRYYDKRAEEYLSEEACIKYQLLVEERVVEVLADFGICSQEVVEDVRSACKKVSVEEVYEEEKKIKHLTRALVNCIKKNLKDQKHGRFVHLFLTSYDIIDTANSLRYKKFTEEVLLKELVLLEENLIELAIKYKDLPQIGRTHGQWAVPITFGFFICGYVDRLGGRIIEIKRAKDNLIGKISGAVGAYNAMSLGIKDVFLFEEKVLGGLGLKRERHSSQIIHPEPLTDFIYYVISCFCVLANLADDIRHLFRSEIAELAMDYKADDVGSSTMPHKVNPRDFENIKSLWKVSFPYITTLLLDSLSEHQRDLTNSASSRFIPQVLTIFLYTVGRIKDSIKKLRVDEENIKKNLEHAKDFFVLEPLHIILSLTGMDDAYEYVRDLTQQALADKKRPIEAIYKDRKVEEYMKRVSSWHKDVLDKPELLYTGKAKEVVEKVCSHWKSVLDV